MKLLIFGDIHQDLEALRSIIGQKADLYICHGDLSDRGQGLADAAQILAPLKTKLWLLPGNNETVDQIKSLCQQFGFINFHQKAIRQGSHVLAGLGYTAPTPFATPGEVSEEEFERGLKQFASQKNLLLFTHDAPKATALDLISGGIHVGNQAVRNFLDQHQPLYSFSGHIHENAGKSQSLGLTTCFNVGKKGLVFRL